MALWSIILQNSAFEQVGQFVNVAEHKTDVALNKTRTFQMKVRLDNVLAPVLAVNSGLEPLYFEVQRNGVEMFHGPLMTLQEAGDENGATLQVNAAGPEIIFASRLINTETPGKQIEGLKLLSGVQRAVRFKELLDIQNARSPTHIDSLAGPIESTNTGAYETTSFRTLAEVLQDMYSQAEGFDWYVKPQPASANEIGRLIIQDVIGTNQPGAAFEWGAGRTNVSSFTRIVDLTNLTNSGWNVSPSGPEATSAPTIQKLDAEAIEKWGLHEAMVPLSALNITMREAITLEALNYRKKPRQTVAFQPATDDGTGRVPQFEQDFGVGDFVPLRIVYNQVEHLDAMMRCWGASFAVNKDGKETQTIMTSEE